jgi:hypothetical protein
VQTENCIFGAHRASLVSGLGGVGWAKQKRRLAELRAWKHAGVFGTSAEAFIVELTDLIDTRGSAARFRLFGAFARSVEEVFAMVDVGLQLKAIRANKPLRPRPDPSPSS